LSDEDDIDYPNARDGYWRKGDGGAAARIGHVFERAKQLPTVTIQSVGDKTCRICNASARILLTYPGESRRSVCAECQGKRNRQVCNDMAAAVKTLKNGPFDNQSLKDTRDSDYRRAAKLLTEQGYRDTVDHFEKKRAESSSDKRTKRGDFA
jgi:hypothetical protein